MTKGVAATPPGAREPSQQAEVWLPIVGYEALYQVSSLGRLMNAAGKILSTNGRDRHGYAVVSLSKAGARHTYNLHRLVALTFHGDRKNELHKEAAHVDGNKLNNRADNLRWVSTGENNYHKRLHGTHQAGERHPRARLRAEDVLAIKRQLAAKRPHTALAAMYGVSRHCIEDISRGRRWKHLETGNG